jgi:hypothetical protein
LAHGADFRGACVVKQAAAINAAAVSVEANVLASRRRAVRIDMTDQFCTDEVCRPMRNNAVVYRDELHMSEPYSKTIEPVLSRRLDAAFAAVASRP